MRNSFGAKFCQFELRRWLILMSLIAATLLLCQSLMLPYRNALWSLLTLNHDIVERIEDDYQPKDSFKKFMDDNAGFKVPYTASTFVSTELDIDNIKFDKGDNIIHDAVVDKKDWQNATDLEDDGVNEIAEFVGNGKFDDDFKLDEYLRTDNSSLESTKDLEGDSKENRGLPVEQLIKSDGNISADKTNPKEKSNKSPEEVHLPLISSVNNISSTQYVASDENTSPAGHMSLPKARTSSEHNLTSMTNTPAIKKKSCDTPPKSVTLIYEMNHILIRNRRASRSAKPLWSTVCDKEILAAKENIQNTPVIRSLRADDELYAPLFRNFSTFKRSYELMERVLKVYVYKDGKKPIFHQPIMKGLYASEGWFMKIMENNKHFLVKNPKKAHLFYMPFSSRMLEYTLYVPNSHNRTILRTHLREYAENIASKYPFWNRTGGSDHFLVACHDWAPYETRHHMENCIKAFCNADVSGGFKIGRDVSLPETYVRSQRNPQRDIGGNPASQRNILAFYAGNMHGYLRPILLKHWKDKDPDMKIFGRMPAGVASKMNYIQHMKHSKYCLCPKGYEVNSPRVVEAIFYECVPVIISDNFVPPLFDVLNWEAFSVIIAEKDIPDLKNILSSIPESKYLELQLAVRRAQRHFLWHAKPLKYDLFHMILHSIWNNRVFQM